MYLCLLFTLVCCLRFFVVYSCLLFTLVCCCLQLAPAYEGLELGIGESVLVKAIAGATGRSVQQIKAEAVQKGDLGLVAESSRSTQRTMFAPPKLTVPAVFKKLKEIAAMSGNAVGACFKRSCDCHVNIM